MKLNKFIFYSISLLCGIIVGLFMLSFLVKPDDGDLRRENTTDPSDPTATYRDVIDTCYLASNFSDSGMESFCKAKIDDAEQDKHVTVHAKKDAQDVWHYWIEYS